MNLAVTLYIALLFVLLTPGVLLRLPIKGSLLTLAIIHGLVFALIYHFTHRVVYHLSEGFQYSQFGSNSNGSLCGPGAHFVPEVGMCRINTPPSKSPSGPPTIPRGGYMNPRPTPDLPKKL